MKRTIGVLALQGDFEAHAHAIRRAGAEAVEVRTAAGLDAVDGLVIPGGESTTMLKLLDIENLFEPLRRFGEAKPIFGTCAGAILLATEVLHPPQASLGLMDMTVERNAYGRQIDSRIVPIEVDGKPVEAVFIRAPIIRRVGEGGTVLASYNGDPVLVRQGRHTVATFHPELSQGSEIHRRFVEQVARASAQNNREGQPFHEPRIGHSFVDRGRRGAGATGAKIPHFRRPCGRPDAGLRANVKTATRAPSAKGSAQKIVLVLVVIQFHYRFARPSW